jgi:hypothetical protein
LFRITVHNDSRELIGPYSIRLIDMETGLNVSNNIAVTPEGALFPGGTMSWDFAAKVPHHYGVRIRGDIVFRDSSGNNWRRRNVEPIELFTERPPWVTPTS